MRAGLVQRGYVPGGTWDGPADRCSKRPVDGVWSPSRWPSPSLSCAKLFGGNSGVNFGARPAPNAHARAGFSAYPELASLVIATPDGLPPWRRQGAFARMRARRLVQG